MVAADVYAHPQHVGRVGWTWYTGSAGWMYRTAIEGILGLQRNGSTFAVDPTIPTMWPGFSLVWRFGRTRYEVHVSNEHHRCSGVSDATLDGQPVDARAIPLVDDGGVHEVTIVLGGEGSERGAPGSRYAESRGGR